GATARTKNDLGIKHIYLNRETKVAALEDFAHQVNIPLEKMVYMGDDFPDLAPMSMVRLGVAPSDAIDSIRAKAHYTSAFVGGNGCVRDIIEQVLRSRGDWFE
ncbi:MAG: HAD hydrolase family protein, partial [Rikenellaceae bacterium]